MQFGFFTVVDLTTDPVTGTTLTEHERIKATVAIAQKAEEVRLDVFATGEHHNPPFAAPGNPPVLLAHLAAKTENAPTHASLLAACRATATKETDQSYAAPVTDRWTGTTAETDNAPSAL